MLLLAGAGSGQAKKLGQHEFHMTLTKYKKDVLCVCGGGFGRVERKIGKSDIICSVVEDAIGCLQHKKAVCVCVSDPDSSISETLCRRKTERVHDQSRHVTAPHPGLVPKQRHTSVYIHVQNTH